MITEAESELRLFPRVLVPQGELIRPQHGPLRAVPARRFFRPEKFDVTAAVMVGLAERPVVADELVAGHGDEPGDTLGAHVADIRGSRRANPDACIGTLRLEVLEDGFGAGACLAGAATGQDQPDVPVAVRHSLMLQGLPVAAGRRCWLDGVRREVEGR